ncbi:MAG: hypothetical protein LUD51_00375, partial [Clostridia bacterium]|nr:hypothetical protein [Clostridia bacterium]
EIKAGVVGAVKSTYGKKQDLHSNSDPKNPASAPKLPSPDVQIRLDNLPSSKPLDTAEMYKPKAPAAAKDSAKDPAKDSAKEPSKEPAMAGMTAAKPAVAAQPAEPAAKAAKALEAFAEPAPGKEKPVQEAVDYREFEYKGNLFSTYLIFEYGDTVYFIDQHAAHERLIYNTLMDRLAKREIMSQPLLFGYVFDTNPEEARFLSANLELISELGFEISEFGPASFKVDAVPLDLQDIEIKDFIDEILSRVGELKAIKLQDILKDKIAMTACKHAIKGGWSLTESEIKELFRLLGGDWGLKCPHGRPICVRLTRTDIEKMFKRIV